MKGKRVWVAGHRGMVGSAIVRRLESADCTILTAGRETVDLCRQDAVERWMSDNKPDVVFLAAAHVGGIYANDTRPAEFIHDNLVIETNVIHGAWKAGVEKLLFLGSACIYPRMAEQPMKEEALLTGPLEPTNEWYAVAKIAGIKMCQAYRKQYGCDFISAQPNNLYGPEDNFDLKNSHVIPALIAKAHAAKEKDEAEMIVWGSGSPLREFLHVDDLADALVFLVENYSGDIPLNIGTGDEMSIRQLAETVIDVVGFNGKLAFDSSKPDGAPRKLIDSFRLHAMGWKASITMREGLAETYAWYLKNKEQLTANRGGQNDQVQ
ncbi:MAG: GDP-L-fucose synthase [Rhodospirillales bacterium]|nr:GDP-L-fucose synthase [Rhodospirillales bacterium]